MVSQIDCLWRKVGDLESIFARPNSTAHFIGVISKKTSTSLYRPDVLSCGNPKMLSTPVGAKGDRWLFRHLELNLNKNSLVGSVS